MSPTFTSSSPFSNSGGNLHQMERNVSIKQETNAGSQFPTSMHSYDGPQEEPNMGGFPNPALPLQHPEHPNFRRSCSHDENRRPPPQYRAPVKQEPVMFHHQPHHSNPNTVHRQMSMPTSGASTLPPQWHSPSSLRFKEGRRSSEPMMNPFNSLPNCSHPYPSPTTPNMPSFPKPDLYYVNLASYHHHQQMESIKRQELARGE